MSNKKIDLEKDFEDMLKAYSKVFPEVDLLEVNRNQDDGKTWEVILNKIKEDTDIYVRLSHENSLCWVQIIGIHNSDFLGLVVLSNSKESLNRWDLIRFEAKHVFDTNFEKGRFDYPESGVLINPIVFESINAELGPELPGLQIKEGLYANDPVFVKVRCEGEVFWLGVLSVKSHSEYSFYAIVDNQPISEKISMNDIVVVKDSQVIDIRRGWDAPDAELAEEKDALHPFFEAFSKLLFVFLFVFVIAIFASPFYIPAKEFVSNYWIMAVLVASYFKFFRI